MKDFVNQRLTIDIDAGSFWLLCLMGGVFFGTLFAVAR